MCVTYWLPNYAIDNLALSSRLLSLVKTPFWVNSTLENGRVEVTTNNTRITGIRLSHIFEIPSIPNEKPSIPIEKLGFSYLEFEILGISSKIPSILETWNFD